MSAETTGILFIQPECLHLCSKISLVPREKQIVKKDQFSKKLKIRSNDRYAISLPEIYALNLIIDYYRKMGWVKENDFSAVDKHLKMLKKSLIQKLCEFKVKIASPLNSDFTNFICSFGFESLNNREIARKLWSRNIFVSYIHRSDAIRTSFSMSNTLKETDRFVSEIRRTTNSEKP